MSRAKDLTGQRFGKLIVVERAPNHITQSGTSVVMWKCLCDCQLDKDNPEYVYKRGVELRRGNGWSCGCDISEKRSKSLTKNLIGQKFGRLTVLEYVGTKTYGKKKPIAHALWKCICDCQLHKDKKDWKYTFSTTHELTSGNTQSCGCYKLERLVESGKARRTTNRYEKHNGYYIGYTQNGEKFYVDEDDFELIKKYKWFVDNNGYVATRTTDDGFMYMHRLVMGLTSEDKLVVDHIRGSETKTDNRKINLRIATRSKNQMNRKIQSNNTSGVVGVWYNKKTNKWVAEIMANKKKYHLGSFSTIEEAEKVRREAENIIHGDYSYRNSQLKGNKKLQELEQMQDIA